MKEAGYKPEDITLTLDGTNGYLQMDSQIVQAAAAQLEKIGIKVTMQQNEPGVFMQRVRDKKIKDMYFYITAASTTAENLYSYFFAKGAMYNYSNNPEIEDALTKAAVIWEPEARKKAYSEIQVRLVDEAYWIPLWRSEELYGASKNLDFNPTYTEFVQVNEMRWK